MITPKMWGYEEEIVNLEYCGKKMVVNDQHRCSVHSHGAKDEVLYVAEGLLWFEAGASPSAMSGFWMGEGDRTRVKPGTWHRFSAVSGDAVIFEFSTHHEDSDSARDVPSGRLPDDEYQALVASYVRGASERSVVSLEAARAISDDVKARGGVVGMCNGCFDLMHMGHVGLLREAKARCSTLFVVVNSDASVRAMKGAARPFVPQEARAMMVSLNKFVDYVVISEETTCLKAADAIRPQVYVTTTECSDKSPEAREVLHSGGQVIVIGMLPGYNTTKIATEIAGKKTEKS